MCTAKKSVAGRVPPSARHFTKHEFREFLAAVVDAMPPDTEALNTLLGFLRSHVTVSPHHMLSCVSLIIPPYGSMEGYLVYSVFFYILRES